MAGDRRLLGAPYHRQLRQAFYTCLRIVMGTDDPAFELLDRRRVVTHWVGVIPTPRQAAVLLEEHGGLPDEERGNPHNK
jgi:hypothetical protein